MVKNCQYEQESDGDRALLLHHLFLSATGGMAKEATVLGYKRLTSYIYLSRSTVIFVMLLLKIITVIITVITKIITVIYMKMPPAGSASELPRLTYVTSIALSQQRRR